jgi:hypothetical protein
MNGGRVAHAVPVASRSPTPATLVTLLIFALASKVGAALPRGRPGDVGARYSAQRIEAVSKGLSDRRGPNTHCGAVGRSPRTRRNAGFVPQCACRRCRTVPARAGDRHDPGLGQFASRGAPPRRCRILAGARARYPAPAARAAGEASVEQPDEEHVEYAAMCGVECHPLLCLGRRLLRAREFSMAGRTGSRCDVRRARRRWYLRRTRLAAMQE